MLSVGTASHLCVCIYRRQARFKWKRNGCECDENDGLWGKQCVRQSRLHGRIGVVLNLNTISSPLTAEGTVKRRTAAYDFSSHSLWLRCTQYSNPAEINSRLHRINRIWYVGQNCLAYARTHTRLAIVLRLICLLTHTACHIPGYSKVNVCMYGALCLFPSLHFIRHYHNSQPSNVHAHNRSRMNVMPFELQLALFACFT